MTSLRRPPLTVISITALAAIAAIAGVLLGAGQATGDSGASGLMVDGNQLWHQDSPGVEGIIDGGEEFGSALAIGDFNDDGFGDLAIGVHEEDIGEENLAGAVNVLYGTADGLSADNDQLWTQDSSGVADASEASDQFGLSLATGDFDGDGFGDLAIGVPGEDVEGINSAGAVQVLYGSEDGLTAVDSQFWTQFGEDVLGDIAAQDEFGEALATGDFNGDGEDDLAIGVPGEDAGGMDSAGGVNILFGSAEGLTDSGDQLWSQASTDIDGVAEENDHLGAALAAGDFNGDGEDDLAIGAPDEDVELGGPFTNAGSVNIIYGSPTGLSAAGDQIVHQDVAGVPNSAETNDNFGEALAAGDFNGDGNDELAIGIPGESVDAEDSAGMVFVLPGSGAGLVLDSGQIWTKGLQLMAGALDNDANDRFGAVLASGNFNGDDEDDLAVGTPGHDTGKIGAAGAVHVFFGSAVGLAGTGRQFYQAGEDGILGEPTVGANFGDALATGDLNGAGDDDLAIGAQDTDVEKLVNAGTVHVIYSDEQEPTPTDSPEPTDTPEPEATDTPVGDTPTPTSPGPTPTPPPGDLIGDVDCSEAVNAIDAAFLLQFVAALITELPCPENADTNEDGEINTIDAALILQFVAGLLSELPPA